MSDGAPYISRSGDAFAYNRRGEVASATIADNAAAYAYDHLSRRVRKSTLSGVHTYFYDGWNLVLELIEHDGVTDRIEYVWGKDISGTLQGAGGIGGLLYLKRNGIIYIPHYDAYGNILGYYDAAGNIVASYTYDAFGKTIAQTGALADVFAFRFSTKYFDSESGHYYYGYRYYSPVLRRWITRDPIEESGGVNLYGFCGGSGIGRIDILGLARMLTRSIITSRGTDVWGAGGESNARDVLRYLHKLETSGIKRTVRIKDFSLTPLTEIIKDVEDYSDDVYFIAHGSLTIDGVDIPIGSKYERKGDEVVRSYYSPGTCKPIDVSLLGSKLNRANTFGCYISPHVVSYANGIIQSAWIDSYPKMYCELLNRLIAQYGKNCDKRECSKIVIVYEGENGQGEPDIGTNEALWYYPPAASEKPYQDIIEQETSR